MPLKINMTKRKFNNATKMIWNRWTYRCEMRIPLIKKKEKMLTMKRMMMKIVTQKRRVNKTKTKMMLNMITQIDYF